MLLKQPIKNRTKHTEMLSMTTKLYRRAIWILILTSCSTAPQTRNQRQESFPRSPASQPRVRSENVIKNEAFFKAQIKRLQEEVETYRYKVSLFTGGYGFSREHSWLQEQDQIILKIKELALKEAEDLYLKYKNGELPQINDYVIRDLTQLRFLAGADIQHMGHVPVETKVSDGQTQTQYKMMKGARRSQIAERIKAEEKIREKISAIKIPNFEQHLSKRSHMYNLEIREIFSDFLNTRLLSSPKTFQELQTWKKSQSQDLQRDIDKDLRNLPEIEHQPYLLRAWFIQENPEFQELLKIKDVNTDNINNITLALLSCLYANESDKKNDLAIFKELLQKNETLFPNLQSNALNNSDSKSTDAVFDKLSSVGKIFYSLAYLLKMKNESDQVRKYLIPALIENQIEYRFFQEFIFDELERETRPRARKNIKMDLFQESLKPILLTLKILQINQSKKQLKANSRDRDSNPDSNSELLETDVSSAEKPSQSQTNTFSLTNLLVSPSTPSIDLPSGVKQGSVESLLFSNYYNPEETELRLKKSRSSIQSLNDLRSSLSLTKNKDADWSQDKTNQRYYTRPEIQGPVLTDPSYACQTTAVLSNFEAVLSQQNQKNTEDEDPDPTKLSLAYAYGLVTAQHYLGNIPDRLYSELLKKVRKQTGGLMKPGELPSLMDQGGSYIGAFQTLTDHFIVHDGDAPRNLMGEGYYPESIHQFSADLAAKEDFPKKGHPRARIVNHVYIENSAGFDSSELLRLITDMVDSKNDPVISISTDARTVLENWFRPIPGEMGHALNIVDYKNMKSPFDCKTKKAFLVRDSFVMEPIHYWVSAEELLPLIFGIGKVTQVQNDIGFLDSK